MASKPNAERVYQVIARILERRYEVKIDYILEAPGHTGQIVSPENKTTKQRRNA